MTQPSKKPDVVAAEPASATPSWRGGRLIWGMFFIAIGVITLLANLGVVSIELPALWQLWPVVIIVAGLSVLSLRGWLGTVAYTLAAIATIALVWVALTGAVADTADPMKSTYSVDRANDGVQQLNVAIEAGASSIDVSGGVGSGLVSGSLDSSVSKLQKTSQVSGSTQTVSLSLDRDWQWWQGGARNDLRVRVAQTTPTAMTIDAGASSIKANLSQVMLQSLSINSGASSIEVKLGDKVESSKVSIDTGVSSVKVQVPNQVGVLLVLDAGLSGKDLPEGYKEITKNTYQSANYDASARKISLNVDMGVSSFTLKTY